MASPELHLHQIDLVQQNGLFVQMNPGAYRAASFLDGRSFNHQTLGGWIPFQQIQQTVLQGALPESLLHFIFHMGHTGSTLISRLLDESGVVQSLREPLVLRDLAVMHDRKKDSDHLLSPQDVDAWTEIMLRLWSRCRPGRQCAIVKATSSTARVAAELMRARSSARAIYLSMAAEPYIAVILGGPASLMDIRGHAEERMRRLTRFLGQEPKPLHELSPGELVAASWVCEALTREQIRQSAGERLLCLDFDEFLGDIPAAIRRLLVHFGLPGGEDMTNRIATSPALGQYAKAPEHAYSSRLRADVIQDSRQRNSVEIGRTGKRQPLGRPHSNQVTLDRVQPNAVFHLHVVALKRCHLVQFENHFPMFGLRHQAFDKRNPNQSLPGRYR
jgi:hypothetical protein